MTEDRSFTAWESEAADGIVDRFDALPGSRSDHILRAMWLYHGFHTAAEDAGIDLTERSFRDLRQIGRSAAREHWGER
jgi:hypothetical protein